MDRKTLRKIAPFVKEYSLGRGVHNDQLFPDGSEDSYYHRNAPAGLVKDGEIHHIPKDMTFCYDSLKKRQGNIEAIFLQLNPCPDDLDEEAYRHYLEWVLNFSPWRNVYVTKNINTVIKTGVVVVDPASQKNTMIGGMIAVRQAWDNYAKLSRYPNVGVWWDLAQKVNPLFAMAISSDLIVHKNGKIQEGTIHGGHSPIGSRESGDGYTSHRADNFALGKLVDTSVPWIQSRGGSAWSLWDNQRDSQLQDMVHTALTSIGNGGKEKVNVFAKDTAGQWDYGKAIDCLINEIPNMEKELANGSV